ncbi:hypothetical protein BJY04DRAFT_219700 [Aspergillus karnatakaensis]|uniref:uncharacterized protein n=1 Tax=Aspergillus karnatakaensis TaxID=1810916 RepID=UPI003CCD7648
MSATTRTHTDYSVAVVCALPKEQTAAIAMLDERHPDLLNPIHDHNAYTLGSMSNHNVVIACLPKGLIGTNSAATVATQMISTFPSVRFGLMVGVGGGVPPAVRLGDVVVSVPTDGFPGVVQWDLGKAEQDDTFRQTGRLNNPSSLLLTALTKLESKHTMEGSSISRHLEDMLARYPRLTSTYARSDNLRDVCFQSDYPHVSTPSTQSESNMGNYPINDGTVCEYCDPQRSLNRQPREMEIHYGLIASGNQVVKDAIVRDRINERLGGKVLCFEMEAAGLMNSFPCAIIRGICDYCDSHKNKDWQGHAAALAAALAKELLALIPTLQVAETKRAADVLSSISNTVNRIGEDVDTIRDSVSSIHYSQQVQLRKYIREWLSVIDYEAIHTDVHRNYQEGTGIWFLDDRRFQAWISEEASQSSRMLYCPGIPGAGKTTMVSMVVNYLRSELHRDPGMKAKTGVAFIYCSHERHQSQSSTDLFASLLSQLSLDRDKLPSAVESLYHRNSQGRSRPSRHAVLEQLQDVVAEISVVYVIIDALDECPDETTRRELLSEMSRLQDVTDLRLMVTSRPGILTGTGHMTELSIRANETDIQNYVRHRIHCLSRVIRDEMALQHEIEARISKAANGMFLLARLYLDSLKEKHTIKATHRELETLESGNEKLAQAYKSAFARIGGGLARTLLSWVVCSKRMLMTDELAHALAVEKGTRDLDMTNLCDLEEIVSFCAGLVVLDRETNTVRMIHSTAKDYFLRTFSECFPEVNEEITIVCLIYLTYKVFESGACRSDQEFKERNMNYPLFAYAAQFWAEHYTECMTPPEDYAISFLTHMGNVAAATEAFVLQDTFLDKQRTSYSRKELEAFTGAHLAALLGLEGLILPLSDKISIDAVNGYSRRPLLYAVMMGHLDTVRVLLDMNVTVNAGDKNGSTALHFAAWKGHLKIVKLLVKKGADIRCRDYGYGTPVTWTIDGGSLPMLKHLLQRSPSLNFLYSPFARYAEEGRSTQVRRILWPWKAEAEEGEDTYPTIGSTFRGDDEKTAPFFTERRILLPPIFRYLLSNGYGLIEGVNNELKRFHQSDYLDSLNQHPTPIPQQERELSKHPWYIDDLFFTPLLRAVWKRNYGAIPLLLDHGCSLHVGNSRGLTPVILAQRMGDPISKVLLEAKSF